MNAREDATDDEILAEMVVDERFTASQPADGHGLSTRVAGIIGGQGTFDDGQVIRGIAPATTILSVNILNDGSAHETEFTLILALKMIQCMNAQHGSPLIHGVVIPLSFPWDARNFGCGHTPICSEGERTVNSGVVVVTVSGNAGYDNERQAVVEGGITDPGNAELAITVGATHRMVPEIYGVSFFSCRGPTADGRRKPDILAPGERIYCCEATIAKTLNGRGQARGRSKVAFEERASSYSPSDGTSLSAAHLAGAAAGLMSLRPDLIGKPKEVKEILLRTAVDLGRLPMYQGPGLLDVQAAARDALGVTAPAASSTKPPVKVFCSSRRRIPKPFATTRGPIAT